MKMPYAWPATNAELGASAKTWPVDACTERGCVGNQDCNAVTGICEEADQCNADDDCLGQRICEGNLCREPCAGDFDCRRGETCSEETGRCQRNCDANNPCPGGQLCAPNGSCVVAAECQTTADCGFTWTCRESTGRCFDGPACDNDGDCLGNRVCGAAPPRCLEPVACVANIDCDPGRICNPQTNRCAPACQDTGCPGNLVRRMENVLSRPSAKIMEIVWGVVSASVGVHVLTAAKTVGPAGTRECANDGLCKQSNVCLRDVDCDNGLLCVDQVCAEPCPGRPCRCSSLQRTNGSMR